MDDKLEDFAELGKELTAGIDLITVMVRRRAGNILTRSASPRTAPRTQIIAGRAGHGVQAHSAAQSTLAPWCSGEPE
jgi:hypothetical protein